MAVDVLVRFIADASRVTQATSEIEGTGNKLKSWAKGVGAAIGVAFAVHQLKEWTDAAAELQDAMGATEVIFGNVSRKVVDFADDAADAFGIAKSDALVAAGNFGTVGKAAGLSGKDLASFSTDMVALSGDLASFKGTSTEEAIIAVGAALRGESEPIRKYGVLLDDATLRNRALAMGLIATTKDALTPQQKALAAQAEILAQTKDAQGDFGRTADSAANQQKAFSANLKDTQAALGTALLPVLQTVLPILREMAGFIQENASVLVPLAATILAVAAATWIWNAALAANPIGLIVIAIAAFIAVIVLLWQNWDTIWNAIKDHPAIAIVIALMAPLIAQIVLVVGAVKYLWENWREIWEWIKQAASDAADWITNAFDDVISFFEGIPGSIASALSDVWNIITQPFRDAWAEIERIAGLIGSAFDGAIGAIKGVWNAFARGWNGIQLRVPSVDIPFVGEVGGFTVGLPDLPQLATGGIVTGPTLAMIGERGAEAVIPLPARLGGNTYSITISVAPGVSPAEVGAITVDAIRQYERVAGSDWRR